MRSRDDPNQCSIVVTGDELVELKRHAYQIPECPGLDRRIQKYNGNKPLVITLDELDWLVAVLDAVLHDPKGYACIEYDPWKLECVPHTDERCVTCHRLYDRFKQESERLWELSRKLAKSRPKPDLAKLQIEKVLAKRGCCTDVRPLSCGYEVFDDDDRTIALIRKRRQEWEVLRWSRQERWESIGDQGGMLFDTVEEAAKYVRADPLSMLWRDDLRTER